MRAGFLSGCGTALVTPFNSNGSLDEAALRELIDWQIAEGVHYLVPCGSTGEAATLSLDEHQRVVAITVEQVNGRVPVVAGAGSNDTRRAIQLSRSMEDIGATHLLHVTPMYNKPPQRALLAHFRAVADSCRLPIVIYNVPGRTAINLEAQTCLELAADERFVAVKEASGNIDQIGEIIRDRPEGFGVLSGDDALTLAVYERGGDGIISVASNATPGLVAEMCNRASHRDFDAAREIEGKLSPWFSAAFVESNPLPVKFALAAMGRITESLRLPLVPLDSRHHDVVRAALQHAGALS